MKIIDLLNKIANGEEVPEKIKYKNDIYKLEYNSVLKIKYYEIADDYSNVLLLGEIYSVTQLNDEVEIIEEPKKINHITSFYDGMSPMEKELKDKVNELIDEVNKCTK